MVLDKKVKDALQTCVDYLLENEYDHWKESNKSSAHIYCYALRADKWLSKQKSTN